MNELNQTEIQAVSGGAEDFTGIVNAVCFGGFLVALFGAGPISTSIGNALYSSIGNAEVRGILGGATLCGGIAAAYLAANTLDGYFYPKHPETIVFAA